MTEFNSGLSRAMMNRVIGVIEGHSLINEACVWCTYLYLLQGQQTIPLSAGNSLAYINSW